MNKKTALAAIFTTALLISMVAGAQVVEVAEAQLSESVYITPDGSVTGTDSIQRNGDVYTLTGNISGGIQVQKSYIVIDGAGYTLEGSGKLGATVGIDLSNSRGQDPSRTEINNVTVKNLRIINFYSGVSNENTNNNTFIGNYIANCDTAFWIIGSHNNTLRYNTVKDCVTGISINYGSRGNVIVENNIINSSVLVWLSPEPTADRNYWSDYLTKYPNAMEIGNSGIWDTPYHYGASLGNFTDKHPRIDPVVVPLSNENSTIPTPTVTPTQTPTSSTQSALPSITPSPSIPEFPLGFAFAVLILAVFALVVCMKKKGLMKKA